MLIRPDVHPAPVHTAVAKNRFDRSEWAGAFGDLGTLIPFVIAYIAVLKMEPQGILFGFGFSMQKRALRGTPHGGSRGM